MLPVHLKNIRILLICKSIAWQRGHKEFQSVHMEVCLCPFKAFSWCIYEFLIYSNEYFIFSPPPSTCRMNIGIFIPIQLNWYEY